MKTLWDHMKAAADPLGRKISWDSRPGFDRDRLFLTGRFQ